MAGWDRQTYESSLTRHCFSSTPFCGSVGWDARWGEGGPSLQSNVQIRQLVEMETAISPVPPWAQLVARQIDAMPPCGWAFPQHVEAVCTNIGKRDAHASQALHCFTPGPDRLVIVAHIAMLLDGWLKGAGQNSVVEAVERTDPSGQNWPSIVHGVWEALGEQEPRKILLTRRLLERLRFWLRAPYGPAIPDQNAHLGYLYTPEMSSGGWGYFDFEERDPAIQELNRQIEASVDTPRQWITAITCTWPCAPKVVRFLERLVGAIGKVTAGQSSAYAELERQAPAEGALFPVKGTYLPPGSSHALYDTAVAALSRRVHSRFTLPGEPREPIDPDWEQRLLARIGDPDDVQLWLAALLLERIVLFEESFKSFHFTRHVNHQYGGVGC